MKKFLFILQFLLVIYAIFYIVNVDYSKLKNIFGIEQVFSIFILLLFHLVRAIRLRGIVRMYSCDFSLKDALFLYYIGLAFAIVTPGRVGEVYRIKLLNEKHIPYVEAWEIFILEKYTDLIALLSFFVFSIVMIVAPGFSAYLILLSTIIVSNIAIYLVFNISNKLSRKRVFINKENIASKIIEFFSRFFATHYVDVIKIYLETFVGWMVFLLALWAGVSAVYVLSFIDLVGVHVLNSVAVSLPVSYMGYGIREFLLNALMFNNSSDVPYIAVITIQFTIFYIVSVLVGLLLYFYKICFRGSKYE